MDEKIIEVTASLHDENFRYFWDVYLKSGLCIEHFLLRCAELYDKQEKKK